MGVNLRELIQKKEIELENLSSKKVAIDGFNILYQFLSSIRQPDGTPLKDSKGRTTSHISGVFYRTVNFLEAGIKPCFVFDGKPPEFKRATREERISRKEIAQEKYNKAKEEGNEEKMRMYSQQLSRLTGDMIAESKELLIAMGVPCIQAPSEGEAQAAYMVNEDVVYSSASQDYDSLLFGAKRLVRNLAISGKKKLPRKQAYITINPEIIELGDALKTLGISREQLVILGMLVGTDYNPGGVSGIGPKRGLELVKEEKTLSRVMSKVKWESEYGPEAIFDFFMNPPVEKKIDIKWSEPNPSEIKKILCDNHDFSEERVNKAIERITTMKKKGVQANLFSFK